MQVTQSYLRSGLNFLGKEMTEPERFGEQVCAVISREPHRIGLLCVLLHRDRELIAGRTFCHRHNTDEFFI